MENKVRESNDQASELRKLLDEVEGDSEQEVRAGGTTPALDTEPEVDILNLPPRKEVHNRYNKRTKLKISSASKRLLLVMIILLLLFGTTFYLWGEELLDTITSM
ncbi:hypothetical protein SAMN04488072_101292 [Lentibacillus halodurans]|uniref:Uncharacterized protein n=1 Tax=Lentibacillus halodurans TaxID=237679 RepID=A0A1I0VAB7_9BACI|nr:hypothetical protein [Lentibacillus halodurans]SFA73339.1 hypothetical protein SAMN04488072_101292 [Lentibacillus halodurans]